MIFNYFRDSFNLNIAKLLNMKTTNFIFAVFSLTLLLATPAAKAQVKKSAIERYLYVEDYQKALNALENSDLLETDSCFYYYAAGLCYLQMGHSPASAVNYLNRAKNCHPIGTTIDNKTVETWFFLGQAFHANYQFNEALEIYKTLKNRLTSKQTVQLEAIDREISYCETAIKLAKNPVEFKITNLGKLLNTTFDEHSPVTDLAENQIIFTSNRKNNNAPEGTESLYSAIWREGKWMLARKISGQLEQYDNNASVSMSSDGQTLILYSYNGKSGTLYYSENKRGRWGAPIKFPSPINSNHNETHASLATDGQTIFFTSDRPGGFGGKDIYMSHKLPSGEWGPAQNLGAEINTQYDEESPFIMADGKTLYFSSEGHENMGGFDIFKSTLTKDNKWNTPKNIGYPINTPGDDLFYNPTADELRVYYASTREGTMGNTDIFMIEYPSDDERRLAVVAGHIYHDKEVPAADALVMVESEDDPDFTGYYKPNPNTGKYVMVLQTGKTYKISISEDGYENIEIDYTPPPRGEYATRGLVHYIKAVTLKQQ